MRIRAQRKTEPQVLIKNPNVPGMRPRFGRIPTAVAYSGVGRSSLYEMASKVPGLFRKNGAAVLVDLDMLEQLVLAMPVAEINMPSAKATAETVTA
jgi:hypothetical protein